MVWGTVAVVVEVVVVEASLIGMATGEEETTTQATPIQPPKVAQVEDEQKTKGNRIYFCCILFD